MKCLLCGRHQTKKKKHKKHIGQGVILIIVILTVIVFSTIKISTRLSGMVVKEINNNDVKCEDTVIDYLDYYYDYEDVEVCGKKPVYEYRIEGQVAENSYTGKKYGVSFTYDIVNLENKKINYCDSYKIYDKQGNLLAQFKEQCYLFAPGEKIKRGGLISYLLFPVNNVNYYGSDEFTFQIIVNSEPNIPDCIIEKKVVKKYIEKQTSVCICG